MRAVYSIGPWCFESEQCGVLLLEIHYIMQLFSGCV